MQEEQKIFENLFILYNKNKAILKTNDFSSYIENQTIIKDTTITQEELKKLNLEYLLELYNTNNINEIINCIQNL